MVSIKADDMQLGDLVVDIDKASGITEWPDDPLETLIGPWLVIGRMTRDGLIKAFPLCLWPPVGVKDVVVLMSVATADVCWASDDERDIWRYELLLPFSECEDVRVS